MASGRYDDLTAQVAARSIGRDAFNRIGEATAFCGGRRGRLVRALADGPPPGTAVILLDRDGEIALSSPDAGRWLAEHFGPQREQPFGRWRGTLRGFPVGGPPTGAPREVAVAGAVKCLHRCFYPFSSA